MNFKILSEKTVFDEFFKITEAEIEHDTFDGGRIRVKRQCFERGDSVAVVLFEQDSQKLIFTKQFRYPAKAVGGWILEIPAGSLEGREVPEERLAQEVLEEVGYQINEPRKIATFYTSPGGSSEQIHLYFSVVSVNDKIGKGGGAKKENEDIAIVKLPLDRVSEKLREGEILDAKTLIGLQWFFLNFNR